VHDDVEVIEEDPLSLALAFDARRAPARTQLPLDLVGDRPGLAWVRPADDDEEVV